MDTLLRYGISGYWRQGQAQPPSTNFDKFQKTCHSVMSQYGGEVLEIRGIYKMGAGNYHLAYLKQKYVADRAILLYLNIHYPFLAVRTAPLDERSGKILQPSNAWQNASQVVKQTDVVFRFGLIYSFLEPEELEEPLEFRHINGGRQLQLVNKHEMSKMEVEIIYRWQRLSSIPLTVGDVIFNRWD